MASRADVEEFNCPSKGISLMRDLRVFIASPRDVEVERGHIRNVLPLLQTELNVRLDIVEWSEAPFSANESPERSIVSKLKSPRDCDLVVVVVWGRLGTYLDVDEFGQKPDGSPYTGTEWEFHEALRAATDSSEGRPVVVLFRRIEAVPRPVRKGPEREEYDLQFRLVDEFFEAFRGSQGEYLRGVIEYESVDGFRQIVRDELRKHISQLLKGSPGKPPLSDRSGEVLNAYLRWLIEGNEKLEIRGLQGPQGGTLTVPLERVYVALKVDPTNPLERAAARQALLAEVHAAVEAGDFSPEEVEQAIWCFVSNSPLADSFEARDRLEHLTRERLEVMNIGEVCRRERRIVILGDPGSGKTTITRWLALVYAKALRDGIGTVAVPMSQIEPIAEEDAPDFTLGPPRFPVLLRVSEYAEDRQRRRERGELPRTLLEFLGHHSWYGSAPTWEADGPAHRKGDTVPASLVHDLIYAKLNQGSALVILDGLDEIPASSQRDEIIESIDAFIRQFMPPSLFHDTGNQLVVTSRIAGYHAAPLRGDLAHVTVEPMADAAVSVFTRGWMREVVRGVSPTNRPAEELLAGSAAWADALLNMLRLPERRHARELATNPLLASVIATVFYAGQGTLPRQRVELYQAAIDILINIWYRRNDDEPGLDVQRHELFDILPAIAVHIHQHKPTGFIEENELRDLALRELASVRGENPLRPNAATRSDLDSLMRLLRDDVGLLAAGGKGVYRFLHLTFQEYLAGRGVVRDPGQAPKEFQRLVNDPRWREPLLMALGYVNWRSPGGLADLAARLLADQGQAGDFFPRMSLVLATAITQMTDVPREVVVLVIRDLLRANKDLESTGRLLQSRELIRSTLRLLLKDGHEDAVEAACLGAISDRGPEAAASAASAARLMRELDFYSTRLADALLKALPLDSSRHGFSISFTLCLAVSPRELPEEVEPADVPPRLAWSPISLRFRETLERRPELVERLRGDPAWLRLIVALYGGYGNLGTQESLRQYRTMATYLQLEDVEREPFTVFFREAWGQDDTIYDMAVYLDKHTKEFNRRWQTTPTFSPDAMIRESPFTRKIVAALESGQAPRSLAPHFRDRLRLGGAPGEQAEALLALWAIGEDVSTELNDGSARAATARERIGGLAALLHDAVIRAGSSIIPALYALVPELTPARWEQLLDAILSVNMEAGADPVKMSGLLDAIPEELRPRVLAEELTHRVNGWGDDAVYNAARFADLVVEKKYLPELIVRALNLVGCTCHRKYALYAYEWATDPLVPQGTSDLDITSWVLDTLGAVPPEVSFFREWAFIALKPLVKKNPELLPEVLAIILADVGKRSDSESTRESYMPGLMLSSDRWGEIIRMAVDLSDPYYRARAFLRVARFAFDRKASLLRAAKSAALEVTDPLRAVEIYERLVRETPRTDRGPLLEQCATLAEAIGNPEESARAWARLASLVPTQEYEVAFERALSRASQIEPASARAKLLRTFLDEFGDIPTSRRMIVEACGRLEHPVDRAYALGLAGSVLSHYHNRLADVSPEANQVWTPVVLYSEAVDTLKASSDAGWELLWDTLETTPDRQAVEDLLRAYGNEFIECTSLAARVVDRLVMRDEVECVTPLLGRLVHFAPYSEPTVRSWLASTDPLVAGFGALLLAERFDLSPELVTPVSRLLRSGEDLLRFRAGRVVDRAGYMEKPIRSLSVLGHETVERVAAECLELRFEEPGIASRFGFLFEHLLFDSPSSIATWCDAIDHDEAKHDVAQFILSSVFWISSPAWDVLVSRFRHGNPALRCAILESCAQLAYKAIGRKKDKEPAPRRMSDERWALLWHAVQDSDLEPLSEKKILLITHNDVLAIVGEVMSRRENRPSDDDVVEARELMWSRFGTDFRRILSGSDPQAARQVMYQVGQSFFALGTFDCHEKTVAIIRRFTSDSKNSDFPLSVILTQWARDLLEESLYGSPLNFERSLLLELTAGAAELARDTFRRHADPAVLEPLLARAVRFHNTWTGRAAAMRLLGFLQRGSEATLDALKAALRDVHYVQRAALEAAPRLRQVDSTILPDLLEMLYDESAVTAYATAQLLATLGQSEKTRPETRRTIIDALSAAARDSRSHRTVYFSFVDAAIPDMPQLDDSFAAALRKVSRFG
jgi:hypothetical protein